MSSIDIVCSFQLPKIEITGVSIAVLGFQGQIATSLTWARQLSSKTVYVANIHMPMEVLCNRVLRSDLAKAALVTMDDILLIWKNNKLAFAAQNRVARMDILTVICQRFLEEGISIYLLESTKDVLERIQRKLQRDFSALRIAGIESPPYRYLTEDEDTTLIRRINNSASGLTFVFLGCPKQKCWMETH